MKNDLEGRREECSQTEYQDVIFNMGKAEREDYILNFISRMISFSKVLLSELVYVYIKLVCKIHALVEAEAFILKPVQSVILSKELGTFLF